MQETSSNFGSNLDWYSLSLKPVQKLPQLKMLLERLLKKTPKDHPDRWFAKSYRIIEFGPGQHSERAYRFCRGFWMGSTRQKESWIGWNLTRNKGSRRVREEKGGSFWAGLLGPSESDDKQIYISWQQSKVKLWLKGRSEILWKSIQFGEWGYDAPRGIP